MIQYKLTNKGLAIMRFLPFILSRGWAGADSNESSAPAGIQKTMKGGKKFNDKSKN